MISAIIIISLLALYDLVVVLGCIRIEREREERNGKTKHKR